MPSDLQKYPFPDNEAGIADIEVGRSTDLENQLISKSSQSAILKFTPRDHNERFASPESVDKWFAKGRELHWLVSDSGDLAGIIWYGQSYLDDTATGPNYTFAVRLYEGYAGKGLAGTFMRQSLKIFAENIRQADAEFTGIWLKTDVINVAAIAAYTKFGYIETARDEVRVTMKMNAAQINAAYLV